MVKCIVLKMKNAAVVNNAPLVLVCVVGRVIAMKDRRVAETA